LQSLKSEAQAITHFALVQVATPLMEEQGAPQPPQSVWLMLVSVSQPLLVSPSQSSNGGVQVSTEHLPPMQRALAPANEQTEPHAPQFSASVFRLVSQPSVMSPLQSVLPSKHTS
jgi:hypothetical protein